MTTSSTSLSTNQASVQTELFRPPLTYPVHPYDEMLTRTAERYPEHVAVISKGVNLTYRELEALVNAFANALQELGVSKGQKVCLFMTNRAEYVISWFAVTRVGAIVRLGFASKWVIRCISSTASDKLLALLARSATNL